MFGKSSKQPSEAGDMIDRTLQNIRNAERYVRRLFGTTVYLAVPVPQGVRYETTVTA